MMKYFIGDSRLQASYMTIIYIFFQMADFNTIPSNGEIMYYFKILIYTFQLFATRTYVTGKPHVHSR